MLCISKSQSIIMTEAIPIQAIHQPPASTATQAAAMKMRKAAAAVIVIENE